MRTTRMAAVGVASAALVAGLTTAAFAAHQPSGHAAGATVAPNGAQTQLHQVSPASTSTLHTLKATYFSQGYSGATLSPGFATVDPVTTIKCAKKCVIEGNENVQQLGTAASTRFGLTLQIDGSNLTTPYQGYVPTDTYRGDSWMTVSGVLSAGTHTVQTVLYTEDGTTAYNYANVYRVYMP